MLETAICTRPMMTGHTTLMASCIADVATDGWGLRSKLKPYGLVPAHQETLVPASNTKDCFREFIGHTVKGVLFDALPVGRYDLQGGNKTLVFDDGRGLTFANNGSYWIDSADEVKRAITIVKGMLEAAQLDAKDILALAGDLR